MDEKGDDIAIDGDVLVRKERRKRQKLLITKLFLDYAQNSTLHGLRYITERGFSIIEKVFWFVTFLSSFVACSYFMYEVWIKWQSSPMVVTFSEKALSVSKVPFPSVTICPELKIVNSKFDYANVFLRADQATPEEIQTYFDVSTVCGRGLAEMLLRNGAILEKFTNSSLVHNLLKVAPEVNEVFQECSWLGRNVDCKDIFKIDITAEGVCFNFNALAASEMLSDNIQNDYMHLNTTTITRNWTITKGYTNSDDNPYPRRARENGPTPDLEVLLREVKVSNKTACNSLNNGFKIFVQNPADLPQRSHHYYAALPNQLSSIAIKLNVLTISKTLQQYSIKDRQCFLPEDISLRYFKVYTQSNCRLECKSLYTLEKCGCVWFDMPHPPGTPICTILSMGCVIETHDNFAIGVLPNGSKFRENDRCRCLPFCYTIQYDAEILKTDFDVVTYVNELEKIFNTSYGLTDKYTFSGIEMYFKEPRFVPMTRSRLYPFVDFLAECGGLLGVFLGFSFLSLVEICYYITLRLCCILSRDLKQEKLNFVVKDEKIK